MTPGLERRVLLWHIVNGVANRPFVHTIIERETLKVEKLKLQQALLLKQKLSLMVVAIKFALSSFVVVSIL
jgi:hypothetical protein